MSLYKRIMKWLEHSTTLSPEEQAEHDLRTARLQLLEAEKSLDYYQSLVQGLRRRVDRLRGHVMGDSLSQSLAREQHPVANIKQVK